MTPQKQSDIFIEIARQLGLKYQRGIDKSGAWYLKVWGDGGLTQIRFDDARAAPSNTIPVHHDIGRHREAEGLQVSALEAAAIESMADIAGRPDEGQKIIGGLSENPNQL